jgi:hypothetical protein
MADQFAYVGLIDFDVRDEDRTGSPDISNAYLIG